MIQRTFAYGLFAAFTASAMSALGALPSVQSAQATLNEGLPQVAAEKLRRVLRQTSLAESDRREATQLLGEALLAGGQPEAVHGVLAPLIASGDLHARLTDAHAYAREGQWERARVAYAALNVLPDPPLSARIGEAEAWQALGETRKALAILEPMLSDKALPVAVRLRVGSLYVEDQQLSRARQLISNIKAATSGDRLWLRYIEARILLAEQQYAAALKQFQQVLDAPSYRSDDLHAAATLGASEATVYLHGFERADKDLETFIWHNPDSPWLELVFARLDQVYAGEKSPTEEELRKWSSRLPQRRAALGRYYHARLQSRFGKWEKVLATLEPYSRLYPSHRLLPQAELLRADAFLARNELNEAVRALEAASRSVTTDDLRAEIELRTGLVQFRQHELLLAAISFERAAGRSAKVRDIATYNAALAWLVQGNEQRYLAEFNRLPVKPETAPMRSALELEHGLSQARNGVPAANDTLRRFLSAYPANPRAEEARLALAELAAAKGSVGAASQLLKVAVEKPHGAENDERAAYLAIFLADAKSPRDDREVARLGEAFIRERPKSPLVAEVRMKLGQVYFRQSDFSNAGTQFESLARDFPGSGYAEVALYLAGQSAMRTLNPGTSDRALRFFDQVVEFGGILKFHAREQQALIYVQLNKETEAIGVYDLILAAKAPAVDEDLRMSALIGKGDALVGLGRKDLSKLDVALAVFEQLAGDRAATPAWRQQAMFKKARVLEQLGRPTDALLVYNEVLDENLKSTARDYFWFYKSGFEAARYFEQKQDWPGAIAIYEKIARLDGPRSAEAADRAKRIRVEHFVWE